jgi:ComF family protein
VIVALKYRPNAGIAWALAQQLALALQAQPWNPEMIVPVPLASDRLQERGFNQADLLARPLSWLASLPLTTNALERRRATPKQVGRTLAARYKNMQGAFTAHRSLVLGKRVLLVDDVMTTGATLNAAAAALKAAGADRVHALTVGRATL